MPGTAARTLACAADLFARVRKLRYEGIAIASRIPRMMITTRSSMRVKPSSRRTWPSRCVSLDSIAWSSLRGCADGLLLYRPARPPDPPPDWVNAAKWNSPSRMVRAVPIARAEGHAGDPVFNRRFARADGGAERVRSAHHRGRAPGRTRARAPRAAPGDPAPDGGDEPAAPLPHPLDRAAEAARDQPSDRPRSLDSRPRALPRERVLAARSPGCRLSPDPDRDQDARGARHPVEPPCAH